MWVGAIDLAAFGSCQLGAGDGCNQTQAELVRMEQAQPPRPLSLWYPGHIQPHHGRSLCLVLE